jgi:hypothetical protein
LGGSHSSTGGIQVVEDEGNAGGSLFGLGKSGADPFVGFGEERFIELALPLVP